MPLVYDSPFYGTCSLPINIIYVIFLNWQSTRRAKSLIETGHSETLKLLERKLGGSAKTQMDDASVSTKLPGQSVGLQTTNTLKKMQHSASVQANEAIYASFIEKGKSQRKLVGLFFYLFVYLHDPQKQLRY